MVDFGTFWTGRPLSKLEILSLSSFVYHGHNITIYVYDMDMVVPNGVIKKDANEIVPESELFVVDNSYGPFADIFRYKMIKKTGLVWTDTDNLCLRSDWDDSEYLFGSQIGPGLTGEYCNSVLRIPQDSELIDILIEKSSSFNREDITWAEIGPTLLTDTVRTLGLDHLAKPIDAFYPVNYNDWRKLWDRRYRKEVFSKTARSHTLSIWNQTRNRAGVDPNQFPHGSVLDFFYRKIVDKTL